MSEQALLPRYRKPKWSSSGLTERQERAFHWLAGTLVTVMMAGWAYSVVMLHRNPQTAVADARPRDMVPVVTRTVADSIVDNRAPMTAYLDDAALKFLDPLKGESGALKAAFRLPGAPLAGDAAPGVRTTYMGKGGAVVGEGTTPVNPGIYKIAVELNRARRGIDDLSLINLVPFSRKRSGKIGVYYLGTWPYEKGGKPRSKAYGNPSGFVEVTHENKDTYISEHFRLRDFLTKDQRDVWPKYVLIDPKMLDKLELIIQELKKDGARVEHVAIMSGFRTPRYNHSGGNTAGRANLSRHMYGDAADIYVDNDRDGWTDDIDGNGKVDVRDAEMMARAAERVERNHPSLVGGIGTYSACCGHGPFLHIDVRGYRARWRGSGNG